MARDGIIASEYFRIYFINGTPFPESNAPYFEFDLLPAVRQNLSHPHGVGGAQVPGAPPGVTFTQIQNTANIPIIGGAPIVQSLGINMMSMQFVGAFIGANINFQEFSKGITDQLEDNQDISPAALLETIRRNELCALHREEFEDNKFYENAQDKDGNQYVGRAQKDIGDGAWFEAGLLRLIVADQKEVLVEIRTRNNFLIQERGVITQYVPMIARNDRVYYKFTLLLTDYYNEEDPRVPANYVSDVTVGGVSRLDPTEPPPPLPEPPPPLTPLEEIQQNLTPRLEQALTDNPDVQETINLLDTPIPNTREERLQEIEEINTALNSINPTLRNSRGGITNAPDAGSPEEIQATRDLRDRLRERRQELQNANRPPRTSNAQPPNVINSRPPSTFIP